MRNHKVLFVAALIIVAALILSGCNLGGNQISGATTPTVPAATEEPTAHSATPMPPTDEPVAEETAEAEATEEVVEAEATAEPEAEVTAEATEEPVDEPAPTAQPTDEIVGVEEDGGVWFAATSGGSDYDLFCKDEICVQPNIPEMGDRVAHQVEFTLDAGTYYWFGVEAALFNADSGRAEIARRENGVLFLVPTDGTRYVADVLESEAAGFSIYAENALTLEGIVFSSPQGHEYDVLVGGDSGDWYYQPWLPTVRLAHSVEVLLPEGNYLFNGVQCVATANGEILAEGANQIPFSVSDETTVLVSCTAGDGSGFSIETVHED